MTLQAPNFVGLPLASAQMIIYWYYRNNKGKTSETKNFDAGDMEGGMETSDVEKVSYKDQKMELPIDRDIEMQSK